MPSRLADEHEMFELTGALGDAGRGAFMLTKGMTTTVPWLEGIAEKNGRPVMIAAMFVDPGDPDRVFREIGEIEKARDRGRELWSQVGCFPLGMEFSLEHPYPLETGWLNCFAILQLQLRCQTPARIFHFCVMPVSDYTCWVIGPAIGAICR